MYCFTDYMQYYTVYITAQISITEYRTALLTMSLKLLQNQLVRIFCVQSLLCANRKKYLQTIGVPSISGSLDFVHPR